MDQGDPVRKREAHASSEERLTGKREKEGRRNRCWCKETGDHGWMIGPPQERSGSSIGVQMSRRSVGRSQWNWEKLPDTSRILGNPVSCRNTRADVRVQSNVYSCIGNDIPYLALKALSFLVSLV
ncbi:hypothetical protein G5I_10270 [Acromyrmex echinatior]|uniref:Uncharacterized protein n=1 Tax=Acromyrmex echinatior TaxID=103372 RepID=F4WWF3_ACREC|nr:hypothetical protein G5I_10270 [Acromyrmex echinatior]